MTIVEGIKIIGTNEHAEQYPMLSDEEIQSLADDIAENGLFDPITVTSNGILLDGRNRLRACEIAGVEPVFTVYEGDASEIGAFVRAKNRRRHQSTGSRAMSEALSMQLDGKRENGRWKRGSLDNQEFLNSDWKNKVTQAGTILDHAPDLANQVVSGDLALDAAYKQAERARDAERHRLEREERIKAEEEDAKAFVESNAPDLAAQVGDFFQSFAEAKAVWEKRNREEAERLAREKAEKERHDKEVRRSLTAMYSDGIGKALSTLGEYGQAENPVAVMDRFNKSLLHPPMMERYYTTENLRAVQRFVNALLEWSENK